MSRLIAFGCSNTYGQGLPDCLRITSEPSKLAWPSLLASKLNIPAVNLGRPGIGNLEMLDRVLRYEFMPDDICVILWSHFVRFDFLKVAKDYEVTNNWHYKLKTEVLEKEHLNAYQNYLAMHHCSLYLDSINIKSVAAIAFIPDRNDFPKPEFLDIKNLIDLPDYFVDKAPDRSHPGVKSQEILADSFLSSLNNVIR